MEQVSIHYLSHISKKIMIFAKLYFSNLFKLRTWNKYIWTFKVLFNNLLSLFLFSYRNTQKCIRTMDSDYCLCSMFVPGERHVIVGTKVNLWQFCINLQFFTNLHFLISWMLYSHAIEINERLFFLSILIFHFFFRQGNCNCLT